jgi:integrase/recombinase XerC
MELRDRCIIELLYGCGLRMAELVGLDVRGSASRVAGPRRWLTHVLGKGSKRRIVPVGGPALTALDAWLTARSGWGARRTRWRCLSARGAHLSVTSLHPAAAQATFASGGAGDAGYPHAAASLAMPAICCGSR